MYQEIAKRVVELPILNSRANILLRLSSGHDPELPFQEEGGKPYNVS